MHGHNGNSSFSEDAFSFHFCFIKEGIETISRQYGVRFLMVNLENGANIASVSRIRAYITQLLSVLILSNVKGGQCYLTQNYGEVEMR